MFREVPPSRVTRWGITWKIGYNWWLKELAEGGGVGGFEAPIRGVGEAGEVWEGFEDGVEDE